MSKQLIIAEKPSLAKEIALALGTPIKINGCWEVENYIVTNCIGKSTSQKQKCSKVRQTALGYPSQKKFRQNFLICLPRFSDN